jgi:hypothetical protein
MIVRGIASTPGITGSTARSERVARQETPLQGNDSSRKLGLSASAEITPSETSGRRGQGADQGALIAP